MRGNKVLKRLSVLFAVGAVVLGTTASTAAAETYDQFSLLYNKSAGQVVDSAGTVASQWAWNPGTGGTSVIRWDNPANWNKPGDGLEHFVRDGDWLYLDGYENQSSGTYNPQRVTSEKIGDGKCANLRALPSHGGQQHYVQWTVPTQPYCLIAEGTITTPGGVVKFRHQQVWSPATTCQSRFHGSVRCIQQAESWWDDHGHPFQLWIQRSAYLGKGLGMALSLHSTVGNGTPIDWRADLKDVWTWS